MQRLFLLTGAINGALVVTLGAFGAHGLRGRIGEDLLKVYHTGVEYHATHALALLVVGLLAHWLGDSPWLRASGWLFLAGIVIFSGSLYALALSGIRGLGAITPFGGLAFIAGWVALAIAVWKAEG